MLYNDLAFLHCASLIQLSLRFYSEVGMPDPKDRRMDRNGHRDKDWSYPPTGMLFSPSLSGMLACLPHDKRAGSAFVCAIFACKP